MRFQEHNPQRHWWETTNKLTKPTRCKRPSITSTAKEIHRENAWLGALLWPNNLKIPIWHWMQTNSSEYGKTFQTSCFVSTKVSDRNFYQQELINWFNYKINTKCRMCDSQTETTSRILRGYSKTAQSLCKARHDRMLWPIYHRLLQKYNFQDWKTQVNTINTSSYRGKRKHHDSMGHSLSTGECRRKRCQWDQYISRTW